MSFAYLSIFWLIYKSSLHIKDIISGWNVQKLDSEIDSHAGVYPLGSRPKREWKKKKQDWVEGLTQLTPMESSGADVPLTVLSWGKRTRSLYSFTDQSLDESCPQEAGMTVQSGSLQLRTLVEEEPSCELLNTYTPNSWGDPSTVGGIWVRRPSIHYRYLWLSCMLWVFFLLGHLSVD